MAKSADPKPVAAVETAQPKKPDIPPPPLCFLLDGARVPSSDATLVALEAFARSMLADARKHDPIEAKCVAEGKPSAWTWCRLQLGELTRHPIARVDFGGDADRPAEVLGDVLIVGA